MSPAPSPISDAARSALREALMPPQHCPDVTAWAEAIIQRAIDSECSRLSLLLEETRKEIEFFNWLKQNAKIIHWPGGGGYPIEHAPFAKKDAMELLRNAWSAALSAPAQDAREGKK